MQRTATEPPQPVPAGQTASSTPSAEPTPIEIPRPEHPRPDLQREPWINLNGRWRFSFDPQNVGEQMRWYRSPHPVVAARTGELTSSVEDSFGGEIVVPFPWESRLSLIGEPSYKGAAWYQRAIEVPVDWAEPMMRARRGVDGAARSVDGVSVRSVNWLRRPFLCFGAVDWNAKVWINGRFVAEHDGGYTPFSLDLSRFVRPGMPATLTVRVWDGSDADTPLGKQVDEWYTHSSGIWQTVWLEGRPHASIARVHVTPHLEEGSADLAVTVEATPELAGSQCRLRVDSHDGLFPAVEQTVDLQGGHTTATLRVIIPQPHAWSPDDPFLYDCTVTATQLTAGHQDEVRTYFGLRTVSTGRWEDRPYEFVFLNGEPVYLRGVLDQAFHPDGIYSYPSDDAIQADVRTAKDLGLNMLRCHIKVNDPRYYYWADRLGMLVMYDLPSASIYTPKARQNWEHTFRDALERDYSHPCIFAWILFNETWGLEEHHTREGWTWVKEMYYLAKQLDPMRLVEDNSTYLWDHVTTDINTWHFYIGDYDRARRHVESVVQQTYEGSPFHYVGGVYGDVQGADVYKQGTQPLLNSEYAGISAWGGDRDVSYTFKFLTSELRRHDKICGYVYTELTDVEWEHNGFVNYDRSPKEFGYDAFVPGMRVADLNGADFVGFDCPPCQTLAPGSVFAAPTFVSHWDKRPLEGAKLRWEVRAMDRFGNTRAVDQGQRKVNPRRYGVVEAGVVEVRLPDEQCLVTVALVLEDGDGAARARNYVNVDVHESEQLGPSRRSERGPLAEKTESGYVLSFFPGDFIGSNWSEPRIGPRGSKFGATSAGWVDYVLPLPDGLDLSAVRGLRLQFEAGARTASNRIDWKIAKRITTNDYPQTEGRKLPSDLVVWVNSVRLGAVRLDDDPADSRGVLSLHNSDYWESGSYGYLHTLAADAEAARRMLEAGNTLENLASSTRFNGAMRANARWVVVRFEVPRSGVAGGFNLYGARMGSTPVEPTLFIDL